VRMAKAWVVAEPVPATEVRAEGRAEGRAEVRAVIHAAMHEVMHEVMRARSEGVPHLLPLLFIPSSAARVRSPLLLPMPPPPARLRRGSVGAHPLRAVQVSPARVRALSCARRRDGEVLVRGGGATSVSPLLFLPPSSFPRAPRMRRRGENSGDHRSGGG
jgi:hypothetical protein